MGWDCCEHCPTSEVVIREIDKAVRAVVPKMVIDPKFLLTALIRQLHRGNGAVDASQVFTSQIFDVKEVFTLQIENIYGREAGVAVQRAIENLFVCCECESCSKQGKRRVEPREFSQDINMFHIDQVLDGGTLRNHEEKERLQQDEADDFKRLHGLVSKHSKSLIEASKALQEIRSRRLYRATHATFEDYCQSAHGLSRQHVNHLIKAGKTLSEMETIVVAAGATLPSNEAQLRQLARVPDAEERCRHYLDLFEKVQQDGGEVTARRIREHLDGLAEQKSAGDAAPRLTPKQRISRALDVVGELEDEVGADGKVAALLAQLKELLAA